MKACKGGKNNSNCGPAGTTSLYVEQISLNTDVLQTRLILSIGDMLVKVTI